MVNLILNQDNVLDSQTETQTEGTRVMQSETNNAIVAQHEMTRSEIILGVRVAAEQDLAAHEATQQEIANLKEAIQQLSEQMKQKDAELREFLKAFSETRDSKKKALRERTNAISAAYYALETIYRALMVSWGFRLLL